MPAKSKAKKKSSPSKTGKGARKGSTSDGAKQNSGCPIVGVGGSAGGFEAAMELLRSLSPKTGMAFVIVQHLDTHHASRLPTLLGRVTDMPVVELMGRVEPKPDTIYVQPSNKCVICTDGRLALVRRTEKFSLPIDHFFESLAEAQGPRAI